VIAEVDGSQGGQNLKQPRRNLNSQIASVNPKKSAIGKSGSALKNDSSKLLKNPVLGAHFGICLNSQSIAGYASAWFGVAIESRMARLLRVTICSLSKARSVHAKPI
jgi:hypothetical protein